VFLYDSGNKDPLVGKIIETFKFESTRPLLAILDVQGQVKFVHNGEFTSEALHKFIEDFLSEKLIGKDL